MNTPITWGDYYQYKLVECLVSLAFLALMAFLGTLAGKWPSRQCRMCGRQLQWRWHKPWQYASRRFCPYHDEGSPYP